MNVQERKLFATVNLVKTSIQKIKTVRYRYIGSLNKLHTKVQKQLLPV